MTHHQNAPGLMQADRHADLLEDEVLLEVVAWRSQRLGAAGHDDHVGSLDRLLPEKLPHHLSDAGVETAENGSVSDVGIGRGVEMEDLAHEGPDTLIVQIGSGARATGSGEMGISRACLSLVLH